MSIARHRTALPAGQARLPKAKRSVTLDADLVSEVESNPDDNLSAVLNAALRDHVGRQREQAALVAWLEEMERTEGPADPADVAYFTRLLGGADPTAP